MSFQRAADIECPLGCGKTGKPGPIALHAAKCLTPRTVNRLLEIKGMTPGEADECWPWTDTPGEGGLAYGQLAGERLNRVMLSVVLGRPIREGYGALHTCDNPPCINPAHLYEGDGKDNRGDAVTCGRIPKVYNVSDDGREKMQAAGRKANAMFTHEQRVEAGRKGGKAHSKEHLSTAGKLGAAKALTPEVRAKSRAAFKQRRRCLDCDAEYNPVHMGKHLKKTGHSGYVDL